MGEAFFTPAEVASWRGDAAFVVRAAAAYKANMINSDELRACSAYAANGPAPAADVVRRVNS